MSAGAADGHDMVAAAWADRPGCISLRQAKVLLTAAQWAGMSARDLAERLVRMTHVECLVELTPQGFLELMDDFVARGFRHPSLPIVSGAQIACLEDARCQLGLDARQYVTIIRRVASARGRRHLDGIGFVALWKLFRDHGATVPLPRASWIDRRLVGLLHRAAYGSGLGSAEITEMRMRFGGVPCSRWLDQCAFFRILTRLDHFGVRVPAPAPRVPVAPGMVTQAQANLVWKLWHDIDGWTGDVSTAALDAALGSMLGMEGGLASLTRAGAREVIDRFMVPLINDRLGLGAAGEWPDDRPPTTTANDVKRSRSRPQGRNHRRRR